MGPRHAGPHEWGPCNLFQRGRWGMTWAEGHRIPMQQNNQECSWAHLAKGRAMALLISHAGG